MDVAIVTGADTRFGDAVCRTLLKMGFRIHALGQQPDSSDYDSRYYHPHPYGAGKLAELKHALEDVLREEGRLDLLVGLGGPEVTTGWENSTPEGLVRRLHGCLTEPLLAASVCLKALKQSKGFLIHGHRRPVAKDLSVMPGYFEDSMQRAYDELFIRNAESGLRSARVLYAYPEEESDSEAIYQDVAESVSKAFEIILRQKETCVVREMHITPRTLGPVGAFPNLVSAMDPYQTTVLPEADSNEFEPILIPTEKPKHYVQIAEVKDITHGDVEVPDRYEDEVEDELDRPHRDSQNQSGDGSSKSKRRRRSRNRSRKRRAEDSNNEQSNHSADDSTPSERPEAKTPQEVSGEPSPEASSEENTPNPEKKRSRNRRSRNRRPNKDPQEGAQENSNPKEPEQKDSKPAEPNQASAKSSQDKPAPAPTEAPQKSAEEKPKPARKRTTRAKKASSGEAGESAKEKPAPSSDGDAPAPAKDSSETPAPQKKTARKTTRKRASTTTRKRATPAKKKAAPAKSASSDAAEPTTGSAPSPADPE